MFTIRYSGKYVQKFQAGDAEFKKSGIIVAEFYDGIQVIPKSWLQSNDVCKYPSHYKTDLKIRKAIEKEEIPTSNWSSVKIDRIFGEYCKY